jgi:hypothetical protein
VQPSSIEADTLNWLIDPTPGGPACAMHSSACPRVGEQGAAQPGGQSLRPHGGIQIRVGIRFGIRGEGVCQVGGPGARATDAPWGAHQGEYEDGDQNKQYGERDHDGS